MAMTNSEARLIINKHVRLFISEHPKELKVQFANDSTFVPPKALWCRVAVQYGDTQPSGFNNGLCERDFGIINIQCFIPKGYGDKSLIELADKWRQHWKGFGDSHFEVTKTNAPTDASGDVDDLYVMSLVRVEFRIN